MNNKKTDKRYKENGQIIVLLAVSLVAVMVVAALAVDGGMIYSERRFAQNAADAASIAGGGAILYTDLDNDTLTCPTNSTYNQSKDKFTNNQNIVAKAYIAAKNVAVINNVPEIPFLGYIANGIVKEDYGINNNHGILIDCDSNSTLKNIDVTVRITSQISPAFVHLIYPGAIQTTNEAVVTVEPGGKGALGNAIVSLSPDCNKGKDGGILLQDNNVKLKIKNGGAFSNSCLYVGSNQSWDGIGQPPIYAEGDFNIGDADQTGNHIISWIQDQVNGNQTPLPSNFPNPTKPDCSVLSEGNTTTTSVGSGKNKVTTTHYWPGTYENIKITGGPVIFEPGLYCLSGDMEINGGPVTGIDVTFYIGDGGTFHMNGNASVTLVAPTDSTNQYFGILFYIEGTDNKDVLFNGNNTSYFNGMVYAPKRNITVGGSSEPLTLDEELCELIPELDGVCEAVTFTTQFIGWQVTVSGGGNIDILYNGQAADPVDSKMYLQK
jgi:hypothetical protein